MWDPGHISAPSLIGSASNSALEEFSLPSAELPFEISNWPITI